MTDFDFQCLVWVVLGLTFLCVCLLFRVSFLRQRIDRLEVMFLSRTTGGYTPTSRLERLEERIEEVEPNELHDSGGEF